MLIGVDTGFFYSLQELHPIAVEVWSHKMIATSVIVLYEIQKKLLKGEFGDWPSMVSDIEKSVEVVSITSKIAKQASHIAHGTGIPGLDSLILSSLLASGCKDDIYKRPTFRVI